MEAMDRASVLADQVYESTGNEYGILQCLWGLSDVPVEAWGGVRVDDEAERVERLPDYTFHLGVAYALARVTYPFASEEALVKLAVAAANEANRWRTTIGGREAVGTEAVI